MISPNENTARSHRARRSGCTVDAGADCSHFRQWLWFQQRRRGTFQNPNPIPNANPLCGEYPAVLCLSDAVSSRSKMPDFPNKTSCEVRKTVFNYVAYLLTVEADKSCRNDQIRASSWNLVAPDETFSCTENGQTVSELQRRRDLDTLAFIIQTVQHIKVIAPVFASDGTSCYSKVRRVTGIGVASGVLD